jgi:hypothetical protein
MAMQDFDFLGNFVSILFCKLARPIPYYLFANDDLFFEPNKFTPDRLLVLTGLAYEENFALFVPLLKTFPSIFCQDPFENVVARALCRL